MRELQSVLRADPTNAPARKLLDALRGRPEGNP
jgi:hypothetical protein